MKISNFRNLKRLPSRHYSVLESLVADVDVTIRNKILWWKTKTETRQVFREEGGLNWMWLETGEWTPGCQVEKLFRAYEIKEKMGQ